LDSFQDGPQINDYRHRFTGELFHSGSFDAGKCLKVIDMVTHLRVVKRIHVKLVSHGVADAVNTLSLRMRAGADPSQIACEIKANAVGPKGAWRN
jgi:hypothetical protein